jgi:putative membrane protein
MSLAACDRNEIAAPGTEGTVADGSAMASRDPASGARETAPPADEFVRRVAISDMYEIAAGELAATKGQSVTVREFGNMMVAAHTRSAAELKEAVAQSGRSLSAPTELDTEHRAKIDILEALDGADFDREYANQQLAAHASALALLKGYAGEGDEAKLRQFAQATIPEVQRHYDRIANDDRAPLPVSGTQQTYDRPAEVN